MFVPMLRYLCVLQIVWARDGVISCMRLQWRLNAFLNKTSNILYLIILGVLVVVFRTAKVPLNLSHKVAFLVHLSYESKVIENVKYGNI
jgi:hypothetical protein